MQKLVTYNISYKYEDNGSGPNGKVVDCYKGCCESLLGNDCAVKEVMPIDNFYTIKSTEESIEQNLEPAQPTTPQPTMPQPTTPQPTTQTEQPLTTLDEQ
jgi:hypothetical protein